jgi:hypothetical protein
MYMQCVFFNVASLYVNVVDTNFGLHSVNIMQLSRQYLIL